MFNQKGYAPIFIILLIAGVVGGYLIGSGKLNLPQKQVTQTETSKVDEIANWKTYTNTKYGYSIKYPNDWDYVDTDDPTKLPTGTTIYSRGYYPERYPNVIFFLKSFKDETTHLKQEDYQLSIKIGKGQGIDELEKITQVPLTIIFGKKALRRSTGIDVELSPEKKIILSINRYPDEENYLDLILSTLKFQ